jgi:hypothetical protein
MVPFYKFLAIWNQAHNFEHVLPDYHERLANWLETTQHCPKRLLMAYRGSGKSYIKDMYVAWRLLCNPNFRCINISATTKFARIASRNIKDILEKHPLTGHLVPDGKYSGLWQADLFTVIRNGGLREPSVTVGALGGQITGARADLVIADDLETQSNSKTQNARDDIIRYARELISVAPEVLFIGTPHEEESLYLTVEHKWNFETEKFPVVKSDNEPQCPELHGWEWIDERKKGDSDGSGHNWWLSQYMLVPTRSVEAVLNWEAVKFYKADLVCDQSSFTRKDDSFTRIDTIDGKEVRSRKAYWDPASGVKGSDQSIISCVMRTYDSEYYVHDVLVLPPFDKERGMQDQFEAVIKFAQKYSIKQIVVEKNFSLALATDLKKLIRERELHITVTEDVRTNQMNKITYIGQAFEPLLQVGKLYVHNQVLAHSLFKRQFQDFPHASRNAKDDVIDAIAGCIHALGKQTGTVGGTARRTSGPINTYQPTFKI